jgi:hypothetical protein
MRHFVSLAAFPYFCLQCGCFAVEIGYRFTGTVFTDSSPFGISISNQTPVVGRFIYDTAAQPTHHFPDCGDCTGYRQQIVNGLSAVFGNVPVRGDDYVATVSNDTQGVGPVAFQDVFDVTFDSSFNPPPAAPLVVKDANQPVGSFGVSFAADSGLFANSSLPAGLDYSKFESGIGILSDMDGVQSLFSVDSLVSFPVLPGDYNTDGTVNGADYNYWKSTFGSVIDLAADGNRDRSVDAADYTVWRDNFGAGASGGAASGANTAPEPSALMLFVVGVVLTSAVYSWTLRCRLGRGQG